MQLQTGRFRMRARPRRFHQVFLPIAMVVTLVLVALVGLLWHGARVQDRIARERSVELVSRIIDSGVEQIALQAKDYGWWNDTVSAALVEFDPDWADDNIGWYMNDAFGYDYTFVVDQDGLTRYASIDGERVETEAYAHLGDGLNELVQRARAAAGPEEPFGVGGLIRADGDAAVAGASLLVPDYPEELQLPSGVSGVLIYVMRLDQGFWQEFEARYAFQHLRVLPPSADGIMLPLTSITGEALGGAAWRTHRPGAAYFRSVLPAVSLATVAVVVITALVLRRATRTLVASEARFRDVAEASSDWIWETDADGRLASLSERFSEVTRLDADSQLGQRLTSLLEITDEGSEGLAAVFAGKRPFRNLICRQFGSDASEHIVRLAGKPIFDERGAFLGHRGTASDVTREVEAERQVRFLAMHDSLTGLPNRTALRDRLAQAVADTIRRDELAAVICLDLDRFKSINDTLGHAAGDRLLKTVAARLRQAVREVDTVARLSGDEFAIVQVGVDDSEAVDSLCRRVLEALTVPIDVGGSEVVVSASLGVALVPVDGREPGTLLQNADIALYRAKEEGRDDFRFFAPEMDARLRERKAIEQDLRVALAQGQFELHYQPQFNVGDEDVIGVEALLRWRHPRRGLLLPSAFIEVAEESSLMLQLGEWVLREACRQAANWPNTVVSVNLSPVQFRHRDLVATVKRALADHDLDPPRLELEITERVLLDDAEAAFAALRDLQSLGVRISMDDFGTGYSSLSHLQRFPFDKLKIDKSFVQRMAAEGDSAAIVRAVVGLGRSLRLRTCAEGVETAEQLALLAKEGCNEVQGFYFSEALPAAELTRLFFAQQDVEQILERMPQAAL